jgi:hypothetical protein
MAAPGEAPHGTKEKLEHWANHMKLHTNNVWQYRKHNETEWAHTKTKELGNTGLGGSMFAVAHLLKDPDLRIVGWSQVNQVFGLNPAEAHYSNKSKERIELNGYWKGVEKGWPYAHPKGLGMLGLVRGTLDGTPLNNMFPFNPKSNIEGINFAYATEGWAVSNRAWLSTVVFSQLESQELKVLKKEMGQEIISAKSGDEITILLKAALNLDWNQKEKGWVEVKVNNEQPFKSEVVEIEANSGVFTGNLKLGYPAKSVVKISYGFLGFEKSAEITIDE